MKKTKPRFPAVAVLLPGAVSSFWLATEACGPTRDRLPTFSAALDAVNHMCGKRPAARECLQ